MAIYPELTWFQMDDPSSCDHIFPHVTILINQIPKIRANLQVCVSGILQRPRLYAISILLIASEPAGLARLHCLECSWSYHSCNDSGLFCHPDFAPDSQPQNKTTRCSKQTFCNLQISLSFKHIQLEFTSQSSSQSEAILAIDSRGSLGWYHPILPGNWLPSPPFQSSIRPGAKE